MQTARTNVWAVRTLVLASVAGVCARTAHAQAIAEAQPPARTDAPAASAEDMQFAKRLSRVFRSVAEAAEPGVVHITRLSERAYRRSFWDAEVRTQIVPDGVGSGVVIDARRGVIVTNNHVIDGARELRVKLSDGRQFPAVLLGQDPNTDLAVLELRPEGGTRVEDLGLREVAYADSDAIEVGDWVVAIGSPFGLDNSVTQGIVSAKGRSVVPRETGVQYEDYLQTDAAINPGNSGGPLLTLDGKIVGINTAIASRTGGYDGIGFAIPSNTVRVVVDNILANGRVVRGFLGVELREHEGGVGVMQVTRNGPAERAGLREGDIITRLNGGPINERRLRAQLAISPPGTRVLLDVQRDGRRMEVAAMLADYAEMMPSMIKDAGQTFIERLGVGSVDVDEVMARQARLRQVAGAVITAVVPRGPSEHQLQVGDIIVAVDGRSIESADDLVKRASGKGPFVVDVVRGNRRGYVEIP